MSTTPNIAAVAKFVAGLAVHFGEPKFDVSDTDKPKAHAEWLKAMSRNFGGYSDEVLQRTCELIVANRTYRTFPLIAEIKKAAIEADKQVRADKPRLIGTTPGAVVPTNSDRERLALELILGPMGRQATREGWIHSLYTFTRDNMRLPSADKPCPDKRKMHCEHGPLSEVECCKHAARGFDKAFDECRGADPFSLQGKLVKLGVSMAQKRDALARYVETGVLP